MATKTSTVRPQHAKVSVNQTRYCSNPARKPRQLDSNISGERAKLILSNSTKWVNGTTLHYYFFNKTSDGDYIELDNGKKAWRKWSGTPRQQAVVRKAFKTWKDLGIGLRFMEVKNREDAEIRIGFMEDDGSWSYVGRDILEQEVDDRTMNFGWNIAVPDQHNGIGTAIHEIGHTLGLQHEHQNPFAGIVWNEPAVYESLAAPPNNWDKETTFHNIIEKLDKKEVSGSTWDPDSIMHYPFEAGLIKKPEKYAQGLYPPGNLSPKDTATVLKFYPPKDPVKDVFLKEKVPQEIVVNNSEQQNFFFKPVVTKYYTIETMGKLDTVMVLSEQLPAKKLLYLSGDDNGGTDNNAQIKIKLFRNKTYVINLRVYYKDKKAKASLLIS